MEARPFVYALVARNSGQHLSTMGYKYRGDLQLEEEDQQHHLSAVLEASAAEDRAHCRGTEACLADHSVEGQYLQVEDVVVGSALSEDDGSRSLRTVEDDDPVRKVACLDAEEDKDLVHDDQLRHHMGRFDE